jgi:glutathione S-transferase
MVATARETTMRFMVIVKASQQSEAGVLPTTEEFAAMGKFNEELATAGMLQAGEGLHPSSRGARIRFGGAEPGVVRGPFAGVTDLVAGFWLIEAAALDEAIAWMKRAPFGEGSEIEIRQIYAAEDFGEAFTPELQGNVQRLRAQLGAERG